MKIIINILAILGLIASIYLLHTNSKLEAIYCLLLAILNRQEAITIK